MDVSDDRGSNGSELKKVECKAFQFPEFGHTL
jgi:hypothetical protein